MKRPCCSLFQLQLLLALCKADNTIVVSRPTTTQGVLQLFTVAEDGSSATQITNCEHGCMQPVWAPDQTSIAFVKQTTRGVQLWLVKADGSGARALTNTTGKNDMYPHWMPDSQRVVFARSSPKPDVFDSDDSRLYVVNIRTGKVSLL